MKKSLCLSIVFFSMCMASLLGLCILSSSCSTVVHASNFSLEPQKAVELSSTGILTGTAQFGSVYLPSADDMLEISLVGIDEEGYEIELSHQSIRNFPRFPVSFTVRYDNAEASLYSMYRLEVVLVTGSQERKASSILDALGSQERINLLI